MCRGESYLACVNKAYPYNGTGSMLGDGSSGVVQTAWALLGLMAADCRDPAAVQSIRRGVQFLMQKQVPSVLWVWVYVCLCAVAAVR